jgi:NAD(P) transhydrogenase subunit alpha
VKPLPVRTLLLVLALGAAQAAVAVAQAPATAPAARTLPAASQPAAGQPHGVSRPLTPPAHAPSRPTMTKGAPTKAGPAVEKPAVAGHETPAPTAKSESANPPAAEERGQALDFWSMVFVFMLATFIGVGVIRRVSRLLHTPLMSLTNAISAIAVVGSIVLAGGKHYPNNWYHFWGAVALFASMTNIVSGFLITDRMLKMFKTREGAK